MQGGMNDRLPIEWYEDLLRYIKTNFPTVHIHAFSPPEFIEFERFFNLDVRQIIRRLHAAGLGTIPGGGGEIFAPRVRRRIGIGKCTRRRLAPRHARRPRGRPQHPPARCSSATSNSSANASSTCPALRDMQDYARALGGFGPAIQF